MSGFLNRLIGRRRLCSAYELALSLSSAIKRLQDFHHKDAARIYADRIIKLADLLNLPTSTLREFITPFVFVIDVELTIKIYLINGRFYIKKPFILTRLFCRVDAYILHIHSGKIWLCKSPANTKKVLSDEHAKALNLYK